MPDFGLACLIVAASALAAQWLSSALAIFRCRLRRKKGRPTVRPAITIVRPLRGLEDYSRETIASTFAIDYPQFEILFCIADVNDPVVPIVRALIAEHPDHDARLLIGNEHVSLNPKLNNMNKGFNQSRFGHIVFVDSNVLTPPDYLDQLVSTLQSGAGMVTAPPIGFLPDGYWAQLECAFLNSYQGRIQYAIDTLGFGFAQGKTLFFRKSDLEHGRFSQLASEPAEDAAATKMMRSLGKQIQLAGPFAQLIGSRTLSQVWQRQMRWARLRRASFPWLFAPEIAAGLLPPLGLLLLGLNASGSLSIMAALAFVFLWYLPELLLMWIARWPLSISTLLLRDVLLPFVYISAWTGSGFEWHGQVLSASQSGYAIDQTASETRASN